MQENLRHTTFTHLKPKSTEEIFKNLSSKEIYLKWKSFGIERGVEVACYEELKRRKSKYINFIRKTNWFKRYTEHNPKLFISYELYIS